jgi:hypothetical protein
LRQLSVVGCSGLSELGAVGPPELWGLELRELKPDKIDWPELLGRLPRLRVLWMEFLSMAAFTIDESALLRLQELSTLVVGAKVNCASLAFLERNPRLRKLRLVSPLSADDMEHIAACRSLRELSVRFAPALRGATLLGRMSPLEKLTVAGASAEIVDGLASLPNLITLTILSSDLGELAELQLPRSVRTLLLRNCTRRDAYWDKGSLESPRPARPAGPTGVEELVLDRCQLGDLSFLERFPALRVLKIFDEGTLPTLDGLEHVPDGCVVRIEGTQWNVDDSPIQHLDRRGTCDVTYAPEYNFENQAVS